MASIQRDAMQLALDLLVTHGPARLFRMFTKRLQDDTGAHACGVWLLDESTNACELWMANIGGETLMAESPGWPRSRCRASRPGISRAATVPHREPGIPGRGCAPAGTVRAFNREAGVQALLIAPLSLAPKTLGWIALASVEDSACERLWLSALLDATARQATLALYYSRVVDRSLLEARRQAVLEERNRIARDIHDTLAQGFGAILMQLQAAQRGASSLPSTVARSLETAVDLARTHLVEARRTVAATHSPASARTCRAALHRLVDLRSGPATCRSG